MGAVGDIAKLLEKIPAWRKLTTLPEQIEKLQQRIANLERQIEGGVGEKCPSCGKLSFLVASSRPHPRLGSKGAIERTFICRECAFKEKHLFVPKLS